MNVHHGDPKLGRMAGDEGGDASFFFFDFESSRQISSCSFIRRIGGVCKIVISSTNLWQSERSTNGKAGKTMVGLLALMRRQVNTVEGAGSLLVPGRSSK